MREFEGTGTALATPFRRDGGIDYEQFDHLLAQQIDGEVEALVVCGSTGESATMSTDEKLEIIEHTVAYAARQGESRPLVIAGTGSNVTSDTVALTLEAARLGIDAALVVSPYYNKPTQQAIYEHYYAIADAASDLPIILYNVPGRTGSNVSATTTLRLAYDLENVIGIKEASADIDQCCEIIREAPDGFRLYSGEDSLTLPLLAIGARGVIAVVSNEVPHEYGSMVRAALSGDYEKAREIHLRLSRLMGLNFIESNPVPVKEALVMMGVFEEAHFRAPLRPLAEESRETLRKEMERLGLEG